MITENQVINNEDNKKLEVEGDITLLDKISHIIKVTEQQELAGFILNNNLYKNRITFYINKQAAYNNKLNILDEPISNLDDIEVVIETNNPDRVINYITN